MSIFKPYSRGGVVTSNGFWDFNRDETGKPMESGLVIRPLTAKELAEMNKYKYGEIIPEKNK